MANFIVPKDPEFNVGNVPEIKESDFIIASFVNSYYQVFLNNMQALKNMVESKATEDAIQEIIEKIGDIDGSISETFKMITEEIELKAPLNSPVFSGNPRVPKAVAGTNTLQAASTSFVTEAVTNMMNVFKSTILKTMAEVSANTNPDNIPSAKVVAELNNNLGGLSFYEDASGKYVVGADSVPKKLGSATIKSQALSSGRLGTSGYTHTFVFDKLSKVSGITSVSAMGYSSPSPNQNNNCNVSISGNRVTLRLAAGYSYYEYTCTALEVIE